MFLDVHTVCQGILLTIKGPPLYIVTPMGPFYYILPHQALRENERWFFGNPSIRWNVRENPEIWLRICAGVPKTIDFKLTVHI